MDKVDELVISMRNKKKEENQNIYDKCYINNRIVEFKDFKLYEEKLEIYLPKDFTDMPIEMAKVKYPSEKRPQIIKSDPAGAVNFTFNLFDAEIKKNQIDGACRDIIKFLTNMNPAIQVYEQDIIENNDLIISYCAYKSFAIDMPIYNINYVTAIDGKFMNGIFNCPFEYGDQWKKPVMQVLNSIKDLTLEKEED